MLRKKRKYKLGEGDTDRPAGKNLHTLHSPLSSSHTRTAWVLLCSAILYVPVCLCLCFLPQSATFNINAFIMAAAFL